MTTLFSILWLPFLGAAQLSDPWKTIRWKPGIGGGGYRETRPAWGERRVREARYEGQEDHV
jgi:hypothetical protein